MTDVAYRNNMHFNVKCSHHNDSKIAFKIITQGQKICVKRNISRYLRINRSQTVVLLLNLNELKKAKQSHYTPWWHLGGERRYSSYSFLTSALDGGEWSASRPGHALHPGKGPPVPTGQEAGWASEPVWTQTLQEKSNLDRPVVQSVARHYTN
jgi:hypothetical protein